MINALSVDIEDWFQVGAFERTISRADWESLPPRVEHNTDAVLALFDSADVKATFFTLGWIAERYPRLIRRITDEGHEIASHGWDHQRVFTMSPEDFAADLARTRAVLEEASGKRVAGYRAPSFSIDKRTPWAHLILAEQGYAYSSSVAPLKHDHYGWPEAPRFAHRPLPDADLIELPVSTTRVGPRMLATGGGFFRLFPYGFSHWAFQRIISDEKRPAVFYFHPWDIDPDQPRVSNAPIKSRLRHYTNLARMAPKIERLLRDFAWARVDAVVRTEAVRTV